ncbi:hypothetical protein [Phenylobacterium sp.]|jgi:hypothetical protein|uniref:hypothetical protein n=1 Tax=Phenylobacterium sp. TaxID=1871053 RepID=UPI002F951261
MGSRAALKTTASATLALALAAFCPGAAAAAEWRAPRTPDGRPDLGGAWANATLTPFERQKDFKDLAVPEAEALAYDRKWVGIVRQEKDPVGQADTEWPETGDGLTRVRDVARSSWIVQPADGKIPWTAKARAWNKVQGEAMETRFDHPEERPLAERCLWSRQAGPPLRSGPDLSVHLFVQTADHLAIVTEANPMPRIVRLGGTHQPGVRPWMGDSIGRWDGETLVVETVGPHPLQSRGPDGDAGATHKVTERFTRTGPDELHYAFTVENPALYAQRWQGETVMKRSKGPLYEYACHEGNYGLENILRGGRVAEAEAKAQAQADAGGKAPAGGAAPAAP